MDEQQTTTGTEGTVVMTDPVAERLVREAPEIVKPEPRKCGKCDAKDGNGAGKIVAEIFFNEKTRRYDWRALCQICGRKSGRPLLAIEVIESEVARLNDERDAQLAAAKAAREADARKFEGAKSQWRDLAAGRIRGRFVVRMDGEGNLLCGDDHCVYCAGKDVAKQFAVVKTAEGWAAVGLCVHQAAARRESKAPWVKVPWGNRETCDREVARRREAAAVFVQAVGYAQDLWHGVPVERPKVILDEKGRLLCGVLGCGEKRPVESALLSMRHLDAAGLCRFHKAAFDVANRRGTNYVVASPAECDRRIRDQRNLIERAARANHHEERPATPKKPVTTPASEAAKAKNAALAQALREGKGLEEAGVVKPKGDPIAEAAAQGDSVAAEIKRHNDAQAVKDLVRRAKRKGGKKDGDKGKPGKGGRK